MSVFNNDKIRKMCLDLVAKGDALNPGTGKPEHYRWSVSEELNYWRARAMIAEDKLEQRQGANLEVLPPGES